MLEGFQVCWCRAAIAGQEGKTFDIVNHLGGIALTEWHNTKRYVFEYLDQDAPQAKHEHRAKRGILGHADNHFHPWWSHRLDDNPIDPRLGCMGRDALLHGVEGLTHRLAVLEMEFHTTHV